MPVECTVILPPPFWWSTLGTYIQQQRPATWPQEGRTGEGGVEGKTSSGVDKELGKQSWVWYLTEGSVFISCQPWQLRSEVSILVFALLSYNFIWYISTFRGPRCVHYTVQINQTCSDSQCKTIMNIAWRRLYALKLFMHKAVLVLPRLTQKSHYQWSYDKRCRIGRRYTICFNVFEYYITFFIQ